MHKFRCFNFFYKERLPYFNEVSVKAPKSSLSSRNSYNKLKQSFQKASTGQSDLSFTGPALLNKISEEIKITFSTFKHNIKRNY